MVVNKLIKMLRINEVESERLRKKCIEINKILISLNKQPLRDSELAHIILEKGTKSVSVNRYGELEI